MTIKCIKISGPEEVVKLVSGILGIALPEEKESCAARNLRAVKGNSKPAPKKGKKPSKPVPTADRIKIAPSVKKQCKEALKKAKPAPAKKPAAPLFTADEQKKILALRKKGVSIKKIAKSVKRGDHAVAAFLKGAK